MRDDFSFLEGAVRRRLPSDWVLCPIVSPTPEGPVQGIALQEYPLGLLLHHLGRDVICSQLKDCGVCHQGFGRRWKGFLPACSLDYSRRYILAIPEVAEDDLQRLRQRHGSVKHRRLLLTRNGAKKNGPVRLSDMVGPVLSEKVPPTFDPRPQLLLTHGYDVETAERMMLSWKTHRSG